MIQPTAKKPPTASQVAGDQNGNNGVIPLTRALILVADALDSLRQHTAPISDSLRHGLVPAEFSVVFKLASSTSAKGELGVDLNLPILDIGVGGSGERGETRGAENTITLKFQNARLAALGAKLPADDLSKLVEDLISRALFTHILESTVDSEIQADPRGRDEHVTPAKDQ